MLTQRATVRAIGTRLRFPTSQPWLQYIQGPIVGHVHIQFLLFLVHGGREGVGGGVVS